MIFHYGKCCVYGHYIGDALVYVGKGTGDRPFNKSGRGKMWKEMVLESDDLKVEIFEWFDNDDDAFNKEAEIIANYSPILNLIGKSKIKSSAGYSMTLIPTEVLNHIDLIFNEREAAGNKCRKADIWIEMAKKVIK